MVGRNFSKRGLHPKDPFDKMRLVKETQLVGIYGLRNKRELWVMEEIFNKDKRRARDLLISANHDDITIYGRLLCNRLMRAGILPGIDLSDKEEVVAGLNSILDLTINHYLERRLQYRVFAAGLAKSIHHARVLVRSGKIVVGNQMVDIPSFIVRADQEAHIELNPHKTMKKLIAESGKK